MSERRAAHHAAYQTKRTDGLDLARPAPRRRHKRSGSLVRCCWGWRALPCLAWPCGAVLPRRLDDALAQHYAARMSGMQRELFAPRRRLAEHELDAEENAALRNFLQSRQTDGERWDPVWGSTSRLARRLCWRSRCRRGLPCWTAAAVLWALQGSVARCPRRAAGRGRSRFWWVFWHADPPERSPAGDRPALQL